MLIVVHKHIFVYNNLQGPVTGHSYIQHTHTQTPNNICQGK